MQYFCNHSFKFSQFKIISPGLNVILDFTCDRNKTKWATLFPLSWKMALKQYLKQYSGCLDMCQLESGIGNLSTCVRAHVPCCSLLSS